MLKTALTKKDIDNEDLYEGLRYWLNDNRPQVPITKTEPVVHIDICPEDCYLDEKGFHAPVAYNWVYRGSNDTDDTDEYEPIYDDGPTLTNEQVEKVKTNTL